MFTAGYGFNTDRWNVNQRLQSFVWLLQNWITFFCMRTSTFSIVVFILCSDASARYDMTLYFIRSTSTRRFNCILNLSVDSLSKFCFLRSNPIKVMYLSIWFNDRIYKTLSFQAWKWESFAFHIVLQFLKWFYYFKIFSFGTSPNVYSWKNKD